MSTYTSTHTSPPTCENCGRDKSATYICDACCTKLNAATRKLTAERDSLLLEVKCMQSTIDALTRKAKELQDELASATCDKERCINCGDRLDTEDGHCENCTARALRWSELTQASAEATP